MNLGQVLDCIEEWAERSANCLAATAVAMPPHMHVEGLAHTMRLNLNQMKAVLVLNDREVPVESNDAS